jgi:outer membrane lipoprotein SlyB
MGTKRYTVLAGLMCMALAACSTTDSGTAMSGESYGSSTTGSAYGSSGASSGSAYGSGAAATGDTGQSPAMSMQGVVQSIESVPRAQAGTMDTWSSGSQSDTASAGASGTTGSTGSAAGDMAYRITLRLDDGTTRVMTQAAPPAFQIGDRVRMSGGMLQRY